MDNRFSNNRFSNSRFSNRRCKNCFRHGFRSFFDHDTLRTDPGDWCSRLAVRLRQSRQRRILLNDDFRIRVESGFSRGSLKPHELRSTWGCVLSSGHSELRQQANNKRSEVEEHLAGLQWGGLAVRGDGSDRRYKFNRHPVART